MTAFNVKIDISKIAGLSDRLAGLDTATFRSIAVSAVNKATDDVYDLALPRMIERVNLSEGYVRSRMERKYASTAAGSLIQGRITALGTKPTMTQLREYAPKQLMVPTKSGRGKGDKRRGIPPGMRGAGVSVEVIRGQRKVLPHAFMLPLRSDNGLGVATRDGGKYRVRYGPSVYQMFKIASENILDEASDILEAYVVSQANKALESI